MKLPKTIRWISVIPVSLAVFIVEWILVLNIVPGIENELGLVLCIIIAVPIGIILVAPLERLQGKRFFAVVVSMFILSCLFPPWQHTTHRSSSRKPAGYALLLAPPRPSSDGVQIDFGGLFVEWAALGATAGLILFLRKEKKPGS